MMIRARVIKTFPATKQLNQLSLHSMFIFNILSVADFKTTCQPHILLHVYYLTFCMRLNFNSKILANSQFISINKIIQL